MNKTEIRFQDVLWALKKHFAWICIVTILFTVVTWLYTKYAVVPNYRTTISMCVYLEESENAQISGTTINNDVRLANAYTYIIKSQPVLEAVSDALDGRVSWQALNGMLAASAPADAQIITVYITSPNPQLCCDIGYAILEVAPAIVPQLYGAGRMTTLNRPVYPATPYSPNVLSNVSAGAILGILLSCAVIVAIAMLDTTIWHEEDLERAFNVPVLGTVPSIGDASARTYRSYEHRR